jgi:NADPH2:quinone reductase
LLVANRYQLSVPTPFVPGSEFAGVVEEVADEVADVVPGDRVSGTVLVGAFAEEVAVDASSLRRIPDAVDFRVAAAFGVAHGAAFHVLRSVARIRPGEELVVLGADVVVDPVGGSLSEPALRSLRWGGRFVTVGYASGEIPRIPLNLVLLKGVRILGFEFRGFVLHAPEELRRGEAELLELLRTGRVSPHIGASFPLGEVAAALRYVADRKVIGKAVVDVSS